MCTVFILTNHYPFIILKITFPIEVGFIYEERKIVKWKHINICSLNFNHNFKLKISLISAQDSFNFDANSDPGSALEKNVSGSRLILQNLPNF